MTSRRTTFTKGDAQMTWNNLKRLGWALLIFGIGVTVGGTYPVWFKIAFPSACVLWLIMYDEVRR